MKPTQQLDYALGRLDDTALPEAEAELAADPALRDRVDRLGESLRLLLDDGRDFEPSASLRTRTLALVAERSSRRAILDFVPTRVPFRWSDVAVAAGILVAGLLTLIPAVRQTRDRMSQAGCGFHLQQLGVGLSKYATVHNTFPNVLANGPGTPAGTYAQVLARENMITDPRLLRCPCGAQIQTSPTSAEDPRALDYAYHVGFRQPSGGPFPVTPRCAKTVPLLADKPPLDDGLRVRDGNSPNHHGRGQNVLFADMHVDFFPTRRISPNDDDLFLNDDHQPAPGLDIDDAALVAPLVPTGQF